MIVGFDDTDSLEGMCTTYLAARICRELNTTNYPNLVRLNPNIPFKTRGNGAVSILVVGGDNSRKEVTRLVREYAHTTNPNTNPGIAFLDNTDDRQAQDKLRKFYLRAVSEFVEVNEARELASRLGIDLIELNNGRGVVGAMAAIGFCFVDGDRTFELLTYRNPSNYGKPRKIDQQSVVEMNKAFYPKVFHNVDDRVNQLLITPKGSDPVYCGIRGESPEVLGGAWDMVKPREEVECSQIFKSNQATDAHLRRKKIKDIKPFDCVIIEGEIAGTPKTIEGGHVFVKLDDSSGVIDCGAYSQTGEFREVVKKLLPGDNLVVYGGLGKYPGTVNLEKLQLLTLVEQETNPVCCGRKATSAGRGKGFKCRVCGKRSQEPGHIKRGLEHGFYEVPPRARRHLSKPIVRMCLG